MIEWLKQQYNNLIFELFPILPSYLVRDCYKEFDEKYKEFRIMTENKRFTMDNPNDWDFSITDNVTGKVYNCASNILMKELCVVVNTIVEENKQLKQSYKEFEDECQSTFNAMSRKQNDLYRKNFKLKEENEQLKQYIYDNLDEDICDVCSYQYLEKSQMDKYYVAKCKKGYDNCSKGTVINCKDFEFKELSE